MTHRYFHFSAERIEHDTIARDEHHGVGEAEVRDGVTFVAKTGESFVDGDPNQNRLDFYPAE